MVNEVMPEYIANQGMYYSVAPNFYGYYCTGLESPVESDDHHRFFGLDGQDLHYSGMQVESSPYVYYTPSYEYAPSPYNHYNTCNPGMPGSVIGVDSRFVGTQNYFTNASYQQSISSPAFFPVAVQPGASFTANVAPEPLAFNPVTLGAGGIDAGNTKVAPSASVGIASSMQQPYSVTFGPELPRIPPNQLHPSLKVPKNFQVDATHTKQRASDGAMACSGVPFITHLQAREYAGVTQAADQPKIENVHSVLSPLKVAVPMYNGSRNLGPNALARASVDRVRPRLQPGGVLNNADGRSSVVVEQNRGPRMDRSKGSWTSLVVKAYTTKVGTCNAQGNITICPDQYNREDFLVNYSDAKFFIIKSYSEDDVHKCIKYSVWSSTPSGNKRLDNAYEEAQRISGGNTNKCPVFLFFSVNGSGRFCGVAEMIGPVDFNKDMDFWQQDKWTGSFPVKWHIIKDVSNASFRHIILENNENRPVTNSRDTQEVKYMPGMSMLNIFKNSPLKTSIFNDFMYYEECQRMAFEEKSRLFGRSFCNTLVLSAFAPKKSSVTIKHPLKTEEKSVKPEDDTKGAGTAVSITSNLEHTAEADDKIPAVSEVSPAAGGLESAVKTGSLSIGSREGETDQSATSTVAAAEPAEFVTVGSMPVKVDGCGGSSGVLNLGTIPMRPKAAKQKHPNDVPASNRPLNGKRGAENWLGKTGVGH